MSICNIDIDLCNYICIYIMADPLLKVQLKPPKIIPQGLPKTVLGSIGMYVWHIYIWISSTITNTYNHIYVYVGIKLGDPIHIWYQYILFACFLYIKVNQVWFACFYCNCMYICLATTGRYNRCNDWNRDLRYSPYSKTHMLGQKRYNRYELFI